MQHLGVDNINACLTFMFGIFMTKHECINSRIGLRSVIFTLPDIFTTHRKMFSVMSVCLLTGRSYVTSTHDALDLTVQPPAPAKALLDMGPH